MMEKVKREVKELELSLTRDSSASCMHRTVRMNYCNSSNYLLNLTDPKATSSFRENVGFDDSKMDHG